MSAPVLANPIFAALREAPTIHSCVCCSIVCPGRANMLSPSPRAVQGTRVIFLLELARYELINLAFYLVFRSEQNFQDVFSSLFRALGGIAALPVLSQAMRADSPGMRVGGEPVYGGGECVS